MNDNTQNAEVLDIEVSGTEAVAALERAQVDMQIATAKKYPRSVAKAKADMLSLATLDEETAATTFFTLPPRKGGDGRSIQGPSVRMAEIALSSWGNLKAGSRVIADDGKAITAQAVVIDLEKNVAVSIEVRRRVTTKDGRRYSDDMVNTTANAACSIALRNATFRVVPAALIRPVYEQAKRVAVGDVKSLTAKRAQVIDRLKKMGATEAAILASVSVTRVEDIDADKLADLLGFGTAIKEGSATLEEIFPNGSTTTEASTKPKFTGPAPTATKQAEPAAEQAPPPPDPTPAPAAAPQPATTTATATADASVPIQDQLAEIITGAGFSFDTFHQWALANGYKIETATQFSDIPAGIAKRFVQSRVGLVNALKAAGGAA